MHTGSCPGGTCVASDDEIGPALLETLTISGTAGETYYNFVDGYGSAAAPGAYTLDIEAAAVTSCATYCGEVTATCTGDSAQYASEASCVEYCDTWAQLPAGEELDTSGNSIACRFYHSAVADATELEAHCVHAGPSGGDMCGSWCDNYCHLALTNCAGQDELYGDLSSCLTACGGFAETGSAGDAFGDTVQCRIYHLGVAGSNGDASAQLYCPHGGVDGGGVCVPPPAGETCANPIVVGALPYAYSGDTTDAPADFDSGGCDLVSSGGASSDHVHAYTAAADGDFTVTLSAVHDSVLYVYSGACGAGSCEGAVDVQGTDETETLTISGAAGTTYYVYVDGSSNTVNSSGAYELTIEGEAASGCTEIKAGALFNYALGGFRSAPTPTLGDGALQDFLQFEFYSTETGTFDLGSGSNNSYETCNQCVRILEDISGTDVGTHYFVSGGVMTVTGDPYNSSATITLQGLTLVESTLQLEPVIKLTPVEGGECITVVDTTLSTNP